MQNVNDKECAALQLQGPVNGCGIDCGCQYWNRQEGLRAIRLYHWQAVLRLRSYAQDADMRNSDSDHYHKRANFHLGFVQQLNEFFEIGDTAEKDNDK